MVLQSNRNRSGFWKKQLANSSISELYRSCKLWGPSQTYKTELISSSRGHSLFRGNQVDRYISNKILILRAKPKPMQIQGIKIKNPPGKGDHPGRTSLCRPPSPSTRNAHGTLRIWSRNEKEQGRKRWIMGERLETYVIKAKRGFGASSLNGPQPESAVWKIIVIIISSAGMNWKSKAIQA